MLQKLLDELNNSQGPVELNTLSRRLGMERAALQGMLVHLEKRRTAQSKLEMHSADCIINKPVRDCQRKGCVFTGQMRRVYTVPIEEIPSN